ncbi:MAG: hypothetical protein CMF25_06630 [Kangiellaceae bacterium]|nr:hypothetical protein [Kangiellaceae bacterium]
MSNNSQPDKMHRPVAGRWFGIGWLVCMLVGLSYLLLSGSVSLQTNVLKLLPRGEQDPVVQEAVEQFTQRGAKQWLIAIEHAQKSQVIEALAQVGKAMASHRQFAEVTWQRDPAQQQQIFAFLRQYQPYLMTETQLDVLVNQPQLLADQAMQTLYQPVGLASSAVFGWDPLFTFSHYMNSLPQAKGLTLDENGYWIVKTDSGYMGYVTVVLADTPFNQDIQQTSVDLMTHWQQQLSQQFPGMQLYSAGVVLHAASHIAQAKWEISTVGTGSMIGVLMLILIAFRSIRPLVLALLPIGLGVVGAFTLTHLVFGEVHLLTLVFGASLIGISIDYTFHYLADYYHQRPEARYQVIRHIFPAITIGMLTTVVGYLGLIIAPFPALRQMAVFSVAGLVCAYLSVVFLFPYGVRWSTRPFSSGLIHRLQIILRPLGATSARAFWGAWLAMMVVAGFGWSQLVFVDDIRSLQQSNPLLMEQEAQMRRWIELDEINRFFIVRGESSNDVMGNERPLVQALNHQFAGTDKSVMALSQWLPAKEQQQQVKQAYQAVRDAPEHPLKNYLSDLGLTEDEVFEALNNYSHTGVAPLDLNALLASPMGQQLGQLWLEKSSSSLVILNGIRAEDEATLTQLASLFPAVDYVNKVDDLSTLFARYRQLALLCLGISVLAISVIFCARYGVRRGLMVMLPPASALWVALGLVGLTGSIGNLFSVMALFLVLGVGIDFSVFLFEGRGKASTLLAVILSALTTLLSFGLLALSQTAAIHAFGMVVALGICCALLFAIMVAKTRAGSIS